MKRVLVSITAGALAALVLTCVIAPPAATQSIPTQRNPQLFFEEHHDVSIPLRDIIRNLQAESPSLETHLMIEPAKRPRVIVGSGPDGAEQHGQPPPAGANIGLNFAGVGNGDYGFHDPDAPPDTNASAGDTQVVQWVNVDFAIFNKSTGALISGPTLGNAFWSGFGGECQTANNGDIEIKYDQLAQRWVAGQLVISQSPYAYCLAVSTTSDATGTYNRYIVTFGNNFDDYPKFSVWPDAYYLYFSNTTLGGGADACALDRTSMLNGQTMRPMQCFQQSASEFTLLPSDVDGLGVATAGEPAFFLDIFDSTHLHMFKFHVDFANPNNTTFTGPIPITVKSYSEACGGEYCIPQPSPGELLDSQGDRMMFRLAYRSFSDHEALFATHTVTPSNGQVAALRWYEIRDPNGTPTVTQQGTFNNSKMALWMASIASDKAGDLAMGFSASNNSTAHPSIAFTGRKPTDPLNVMEKLKPIKVGLGSQISTSGRWGDYSSMVLDPSDDCTFWFTTEYIKSTGAFNWSTQITSLKFPNCP